MSPRYFAKFTGTPMENANQWYHFTASNYDPGSFEYKIHRWKLTTIVKKIFRIK